MGYEGVYIIRTCFPDVMIHKQRRQLNVYVYTWNFLYGIIVTLCFLLFLYNVLIPGHVHVHEHPVINITFNKTFLPMFNIFVPIQIKLVFVSTTLLKNAKFQ